MKNLNLIIACSMILSLTYGINYAQITKEDHYNKGIEYASKGEFEKAKSEFEKSLQMDAFYIGSASSLERINDALNQIIKSETALHLFKGTSYANKTQDNEAIIEYTKAIELNPEYPKAYIDRGASYYYKGETDKAIMDFNKSIEIDPKYTGGYGSRGWVYYQLRQYDNAISDFNKAVELSSEFPLLYLNRGLAYLENSQYDHAITDFTKAIELNPNYADAYNDRGFTYYLKLGDEVKGCADLKKACDLGNCKNFNIIKRKGDCP